MSVASPPSTSMIVAQGVTLPVKRWPTPRAMKALLVSIFVLAGLLFLFGEGTLARARSAMKTVGRDAAPSIIAAQEISSSLADLDANAANYLIGDARHRADAIRIIEQRRITVTSRLVDAAQNITYGDAEKAPIQRLFEGLGRYEQAFAEARMLQDRGEPALARASYKRATAIMHDTLIPAADDLDRANRSYMDQAYEEQRKANDGAETLAVGLGFFLALALVWTQGFLLRRTRRVINPLLLAATVLTLVFTMYLVSRFGAAREDLRLAKDDAFASIHLLWQARSVAYDANGDESRYLLAHDDDPQSATGYEKAFDSKVNHLTSKPTTLSTTSGYTTKVDGIFADELRNITFDGERDAASNMVDAFAAYYKIDQKMRALERSGKHTDAIELCIGSRADESNAAFARFDDILMATIKINRDAFDETIARGDAGLAGAEKLDPLLAAAIALLAFFGLRPRMREYD